jgi:uncharacterized repeat protein (TIGR01451 family)
MRLRSVLVVLVGLVLPGITLFGQEPVITDFNPKVGGPGDTVYISGSGFSGGGIAVRFTNNKVASIFVNSDTQITATVPSGISTGAISVQKNGGTQYYSVDNYLAIGPGPYISDVTPNLGAVNDQILILGAHFTGVTSVKFNGVSASSFVPNSDGRTISVFVPNNATNGPISVTTPFGTSNSPVSFSIIGPGVYVAGFSPTSGNAGSSVSISGRFFTGTAVVKFNGVNATFSVMSDTQILATAPPNVTTGPITVGTLTTTSNFFAPPVITSFTPASGAAGTSVTIRGNNFTGATNLAFNGIPASFTVNSRTNITAVVPFSATTGPIVVKTPAFSFPSGTNFVVLPLITGFSPANGNVGTIVTITGANLTGASSIKFGGATAPFTNGTFNQMIATVPATAVTGPVSVTTTNGTATTTTNFYLPPGITRFTPTNSAPGSTVNIFGKNLLGTSAVKFNGTPAASFTNINNTNIVAVVPAGFLTGPLSATAPAGTTLSEGLFYAPPVIREFSPTHGLPGYLITIFGTNFLGASAVKFNGLSAASFSILDNNTIQASVPAGVQTGPITVVAPAGTNTTANLFTIDDSTDLQVWITSSPDPVTPGGSLLYTISILNNGPFDAPNTRFTNTLPSSVTLLSASINVPGAILATNSNPITGNLGIFPIGAAATLLITVKPQSPGTITNTIFVTSDNPDPVPGNNTASITNSVQPLALLSIRLATNQVAISWPAALTNYVLEYVSSINSNASWSAITTPPAISGGVSTITETNLGAAKFYRLKK